MASSLIRVRRAWSTVWPENVIPEREENSVERRKMWGLLKSAPRWASMFCAGDQKKVLFKCKYSARASKRADAGSQSLEGQGVIPEEGSPTLKSVNRSLVSISE
ncbi:hypothetical protein PIB30_089108 [Stylosanthes scabra]|uniref:Uncharacterized protein n=1 Tax=Stylosanthes scabra TaxID=79078 RepID=A0ABU6VTJ7_9FABA|nr:hypothetical protein [Stylosanthes scabra]